MAKSTCRSRTQIIAEILNLCLQPQVKTQVMYKTNLSWSMVNQYISFLLSSGLLEVRNSKTSYSTTQKGLRYVEKWNELTELLSH